MTPRRRQSDQATELCEAITRGTYSRIADEVRRCLHEFKHLRRITVSQNAPEWRRDAVVTEKTPKGLTTIKLYDTSCYSEVWYKTATNGHRAKVFVRGE
jgi:hypothetical protein